MGWDMTPDTPPPPPEIEAPDLEALSDPDAWRERIVSLWQWLEGEAFSIEFGVQAAAIIAALLIGFALRRPVAAFVARVFSLGALEKYKTRAIRFFVPVIGPALAWLLLSAILLTLQQTGNESFWVRLGANLMGAWAIIRLLTTFIGEPFWSRTAAVIGWTLAALNILGWLVPISGFMDSMAIGFGGGRVSVLSAIRAAVLLIILYWLASRAAKLLGARIDTLPSLTPSARLLIGKSSFSCWPPQSRWPFPASVFRWARWRSSPVPWAWASVSGCRRFSPTWSPASSSCWTSPSSRAMS